MSEPRHLAVIVPIYNETVNIQPFYARAKTALEGIKGLAGWTLLFCNNGSEDDSLAKVLELRKSDPRVKVITLSRNFGYQGALLAGLCSIETDLYAMIDVDCEDPPELLSVFFDTVAGGADIAYGIRSQRDESAIILYARKLFYKLNRRVADSDIVMWMAEFSMITRQVRDAIIEPHSSFPFLRAEMGYVGFERVGIPYFRAKRAHGASHYNFAGMTRFAVAGILSGTTFPLRLSLYVAAAIGVGYPVLVWLLRLSVEGAVQLANILTLYFLLITIPFIALYLGRSYKNGVARPVFVIDKGRTFL